MYLFQVKSPAESKEPWDYYTLKRTIPAAQAFRPIRRGRLQDGARRNVAEHVLEPTVHPMLPR